MFERTFTAAFISPKNGWTDKETNSVSTAVKAASNRNTEFDASSFLFNDKTPFLVQTHTIKHILVKDSSDSKYFIFEINVGKSRIRHTTTLKLNDEFLDRLQID